MQKIKAFFNYFVHPSLQSQEFNLFKANALIGAYLVIFTTGAFVLFAETLYDFHNDAPVSLALSSVFIYLFIFKYTGNLSLGGNLLAFLSALTVAPSVVSSGGLLSDNLLWCVSVPIIALLFANLWSGIVWLIILLSFTTWLYFNTHSLPNHPFFDKYSPEYFFLSFTTLFSGLFGIICVFRYEQNQLIKSLVLKNDLLEVQKVEILTQTRILEETSVLLESSNKELEQFAYIASHDLKEPLRMISMYTQMIERRLKSTLEGDMIEFMGYVVDGVKRMQQMLDDLLEYSRLGKNNGNIAKVDLNDTLFMVKHNLKAVLKDKNGAIEIAGTLPIIYAVSSEIIQLFQNLIANGLKFNREDTHPLINIGVKSLNENDFTIYISDNGIGIPEDSKLRIFKLFERLHNRTTYQGTGIGLATCRKVMDNLGGDVWVESTEGAGSTFYLKFPNHALEAPAEN